MAPAKDDFTFNPSGTASCLCLGRWLEVHRERGGDDCMGWRCNFLLRAAMATPSSRQSTRVWDRKRTPVGVAATQTFTPSSQPSECLREPGHCSPARAQGSVGCAFHILARPNTNADEQVQCWEMPSPLSSLCLRFSSFPPSLHGSTLRYGEDSSDEVRFQTLEEM